MLLIKGVGYKTSDICNNFFNCGVNVITTGNHVWDQKDLMKFIEHENRLNMSKNEFRLSIDGKGFLVYSNKRYI